jgi:hypothetical protein
MQDSIGLYRRAVGRVMDTPSVASALSTKRQTVTPNIRITRTAQHRPLTKVSASVHSDLDRPVGECGDLHTQRNWICLSVHSSSISCRAIPLLSAQIL